MTARTERRKAGKARCEERIESRGHKSGCKVLRAIEAQNYFFPQTVYCGVYSQKKRGVHRLARACSVGRGLGVAWAWLGRAWAWLGRGVGVAWVRLGRGVAWAWRGRGLGVVWAWLGRGLGVAWAWRGRGLGVAWAKDLVMLL